MKMIDLVYVDWIRFYNDKYNMRVVISWWFFLNEIVLQIYVFFYINIISISLFSNENKFKKKNLNEFFYNVIDIK